MSKKYKIFNIVIIIIAISAISLGGYFYYQLRLLKTNPQTIAKEESDTLVSKISKMYLLPVGEEPTIATVSDPEALKDQPFFKQSEKGDKVLIYKEAGKAILYRPSIDKIIEISLISDNTKTNNTNTTVDSSSPASTDSVVAPTSNTPTTTTKTPVTTVKTPAKK